MKHYYSSLRRIAVLVFILLLIASVFAGEPVPSLKGQQLPAKGTTMNGVSTPPDFFVSNYEGLGIDNVYSLP